MPDFPFQDVDFDPDDIETIEEMVHLPPATGRSLARRLALQALYEIDTTDHNAVDVITHFLARDTDTLTIDVLLDRIDSDEQRVDLVTLIQEVRPVADEEQRIIEYFQHLVSDIVTARPMLDKLVGTYAPDFPVDQIAVVDRNILRIALWEIAVDTRVPVGVAIDEAMELAKLFGSDGTMRFVNGVLGAIAQNLRSVREALKKEREAAALVESIGED